MLLPNLMHFSSINDIRISSLAVYFKPYSYSRLLVATEPCIPISKLIPLYQLQWDQNQIGLHNQECDIVTLYIDFQ